MNRSKLVLTTFFFTLIIALGTSCVMTAKRGQTSNLLGNHDKFKKSKYGTNILVYTHRKIKLTEYNKFIIDPVLIFKSNRRHGRGLAPESRAIISKSLQQEVIKELKSGNHELVENAGEGVLRLRIAVSNLEPGRYYSDPIGFHTIKEDSGLVSATFELEGIDSMSGERVVGVLKRITDDETNTRDDEEKMIRLKQAFLDWAKLIRMRMDDIYKEEK